MSTEIEIIESDPSPPRHEDDRREYDKDSDMENVDDGEVKDDEIDRNANRKKRSIRVWCFPLRLKNLKNWRKKKESEQRESQLDSDLPSSFLSHNQFKKSAFFRDFQARFNELESIEKQCLLSFIIFPKNTIVKRRHLLFWWIGEGLLEDPKTYEVRASEILCKFTQKSFIVQVKNGFMIQPHILSLLSVLAIEANSYGSSSCSWYDDRGYLINSKSPLFQSDDVKTMINISMEKLDKLEWISGLRNVKALYLGRWQNSAENHHIEVVGTEFLKGFKSMKNLKSLSLEGISGIQELPGSISNLTSLRVLDLRACYNLEKLPKEIGSLKKLTHLDISECYLLDYMPKELLSLSELQVLKGFVITDTKDRIFCSLDDLAGLKKLRKLSVSLYSGSFSLEGFSAVLKFKRLVKLKIIWGGKVSKEKRNKKSEAKAEAYERRSFLKRQESAIREASQVSLEKLELQCLPHKSLPSWVNPDNLRSLKKLYIIGGGIKNLGRAGEESDKWRRVESLRLKYLNDLNVKWMEVKMLFPKLRHLEKFQCPKVVLFPCDCNGIWAKPQ